MKKLFNRFWDWARPYFTWRMAPFLLLAWTLTNGWSYAFTVVGPILGWSWMTWLGWFWIGVLWFPLTLEKPFIIWLAMFLYKLFYREAFIHKKGSEES